MKLIYSLLILLSVSLYAKNNESKVSMIEAEALNKEGKATFISKESYKEKQKIKLSQRIKDIESANELINIDATKKVSVKKAEYDKNVAIMLKKLEKVKKEYETSVSNITKDAKKNIESNNIKIAKIKNEISLISSVEKTIKKNKELKPIKITDLKLLKRYVSKNKNLKRVLIATSLTDSLKFYTYVKKRNFPYSVSKKSKDYILNLSKNINYIDYDNFEEIINNDDIFEINNMIKELEYHQKK